jgi:hypothetical protein
MSSFKFKRRFLRLIVNLVFLVYQTFLRLITLYLQSLIICVSPFTSSIRWIRPASKAANPFVIVSSSLVYCVSLPYRITSSLIDFILCLVKSVSCLPDPIIRKIQDYIEIFSNITTIQCEVTSSSTIPLTKIPSSEHFTASDSTGMIHAGAGHWYPRNGYGSMQKAVSGTRMLTISKVCQKRLAASQPKRSKRQRIATNDHTSTITNHCVVDKTQRLPAEILSLIFKQFATQSEELRACERVCRRWRDLVLPLVWRAPQIYYSPLLQRRSSGNASPSSSDCLAQVDHLPEMDAPTSYTIRVNSRHPLEEDGVPVGMPLAKYGMLIQHLDLWPAYALVRDATVARFMQYCTNVRMLNLHGCIFLTDQSLYSIANACGGVLRSVNLSYCSRITDAGLTVLAERCATSLEKINIKGCSHISDAGIAALARCHQLTHARLSELPMVSDAGLTILAQGCPQLRWLDLTGTDRCSDATAKALGRHCAQLAWLSIARTCTIAPTPDLADSINHLATDIPSSAGLTDDGLVCLAKGCPRLVFLDLSFHPQLTDTGVEQLTLYAAHLVRIALIGCTLTSRSLYALGKLRQQYNRLACITVGGTPQLSEDKIRDATLDRADLFKGWHSSKTGQRASASRAPGIGWLDTW